MKAEKVISQFTEEDKERFWSKVDKRGPEECWLWTGSGKRYGKMKVRGKHVSAHVLGFLIGRRVLPAGMQIRHVVCRNPKCVNPSHLDYGTAQDNAVDRGRDGTAYGGDRHWTKTNPEKILRGALNMGRITSSLSEFDVRYIRSWNALGYSQRLIARSFGISQQSVSKIVLRKRWGFVP